MGLDNPLHIAFLVVILLLVFGAKRLPEIGRSLGGGMREFKEGISGDSKKAQITQVAQQRQDSAQGAAQAFGEGAPAPVPVEPSQPTPHQ